ncbi:hypothetical protein HMSSN036_28630 [Paenibacillus macerans]|nr:hypothetical protein HMSSN036_28630 [Paenibacillus macerans]
MICPFPEDLKTIFENREETTMGAVSISLPDGSVREYAEGSSLEDVAASISSGLRKTRWPGN